MQFATPMLVCPFHKQLPNGTNYNVVEVYNNGCGLVPLAILHPKLNNNPLTIVFNGEGDLVLIVVSLIDVENDIISMCLKVVCNHCNTPLDVRG